MQTCQLLLKFVGCFLTLLTNVYFTLQKVDTLVSARAKVLSAFALQEDRLAAVKILSDFWHNRRKKHKEEQEVLARAGKQIHVYEAIHCFIDCYLNAFLVALLEQCGVQCCRSRS